MPKNPFKAHEEYVSKPRRNSFDLSRRNFLTGKLGALIPISLDEVNAGDSFQIDSAMLMNFFPFKFPVQTPIRASLYFFYGRHRNGWKNYMDFAYNNKQPVHPFILQPAGNFWKTGNLVDYLGVPTTYTSLGGTQNYGVYDSRGSWPNQQRKIWKNTFSGSSLTLTSSNFEAISSSSKTLYTPLSKTFLLNYTFVLTKDNMEGTFIVPNFPDSAFNHQAVWFVMCDLHDGSDESFFAYTDSTYGGSTGLNKIDLNVNTWVNFQGLSVNLLDEINSVYANNPNATFRFIFAFTASFASSFVPELLQTSDVPYKLSETSNFSYLSVSIGAASTVDLSTLNNNPFSGTVGNPPRIPLSALPFRLYEAIYNCYFRNERNDPFKINGEIEYNKYMTTQEDGADDTPYKIYYRNWETDFLTSATPTPQQGVAPLVGINVRGDMEFLNDDGTISKIRPTIDSDGHTITGIEGVIENGTPEALRSAMREIMSGISINDFRQVNSLQKWLEDNIRRGLKYRDQVLANTGVKIRYDELDMPEFIGGYSRPVQVSSITQATPSTAVDNALGDRAGQASVFGGSKHKITHYCDEAGYIMGILCVYPQPVYTQLLPKTFMKSDALSYYHPQFGSIGMQPISYREVCPIQVLQEGGDLDATFGYQRPWYDLIAKVDEAHGNMRTNMRDFLMHRTFAGIPQLGYDFLHIDPNQLNQVFSITDGTEDVFQGQVDLQMYVKRAIPRFGIPKLD